ncbi:major outer membrane protein [Helicobacter kayseriensis]|uniref:major outer membrane protein n=1 Tax=Helicobacter kayseriensis TaxID=2905877 RepID=UPI001E31230E|nr:major outer membrane protein [Helicobacter kayseriensis]MCE3047229.1 major outer membrane protein [Helicobacter kayseriensis]MCE3048600.1 major outer membrane protein [Helicobacter kayseriensis]
MKKFSQILLITSGLYGQESLLDAIKDINVDGYTYGQYTLMFGEDANGSAFQTRVWLNLQTGSYHGFSVGTRVFVDYGTSAPDGGSFLENSSSPSGIPSIGLMSLYGVWTPQSSKTTITLGKMNIATPFSDSEWDFGYGAAMTNNDIENLTFSLQAYGAWGLDNANAIHSSPLADEDDVSMNSSRPLFIGGIHGENFNGFGFDVWVAHAIKTIDFLTFADLNYSIAGLTLQTQVAATQVNTNESFFNLGELSAKLRGLYNIQASYESFGINLTAGYTGSFGDGYGALLNYCAGFNMGGNIWWDVGSGNGYALNGVGGYKQSNQSSSIQVAYASLGYANQKTSMGLSYAYIGGNNQYRLLKKGFSRHQASLLGGSMNAKLHELSFTLKYDFSEKLSLSALVGSTFGDLSIGKAQAKINYQF